ncbi:MAG: GntR family transcriptional regulator [Bryobacterales bacterium]|nr:GntR family transcriptional regulator [Bryobacterales bacterium]
MRKPSPFSPMLVSTLKENIAQVITEAIFSGKLKPGERLNESQLARDLQVSRAPIREALQHLQEQGLVMNSPRRGMFVVLLEDDDISKINSVRLILEAESFRLARTHLTKPEEAKLLQLLERLEKSESAAPSIRARYDFDFHRAIWRLSGNEYLERTLHGLTAPLFAHSVLRIIKSEKVRHIIYSHRPLMAFLQGRSKHEAEEVIAEHLRVPWVRPERFSSLAASE